MTELRGFSVIVECPEVSKMVQLLAFKNKRKWGGTSQRVEHLNQTKLWFDYDTHYIAYSDKKYTSNNDYELLSLEETIKRFTHVEFKGVWFTKAEAEELLKKFGA